MRLNPHENHADVLWRPGNVHVSKNTTEEEQGACLWHVFLHGCQHGDTSCVRRVASSASPTRGRIIGSCLHWSFQAKMHHHGLTKCLDIFRLMWRSPRAESLCVLLCENWPDFQANPCRLMSYRGVGGDRHYIYKQHLTTHMTMFQVYPLIKHTYIQRILDPHKQIFLCRKLLVACKLVCDNMQYVFSFHFHANKSIQCFLQMCILQKNPLKNHGMRKFSPETVCLCGRHWLSESSACFKNKRCGWRWPPWGKVGSTDDFSVGKNEVSCPR